MVFDHINNLSRYKVPKAEAILNFIATHDCAALPVGEIAIEGKELFVRVMEYEPKPADQNQFETHQIYADVQYVVRGVEVMEVARTQDLTPTTVYDAKGDYHFYKADRGITGLVVEAGECTVFYPGEAHRPACRHPETKGKVKKLVFKIKI